jgi:hypothetical protein
VSIQSQNKADSGAGQWGMRPLAQLFAHLHATLPNARRRPQTGPRSAFVRGPDFRIPERIADRLVGWSGRSAEFHSRRREACEIVVSREMGVTWNRSLALRRKHLAPFRSISAAAPSEFFSPKRTIGRHCGKEAGAPNCEWKIGQPDLGKINSCNMIVADMQIGYRSVLIYSRSQLNDQWIRKQKQ